MLFGNTYKKVTRIFSCDSRFTPGNAYGKNMRLQVCRSAFLQGSSYGCLKTREAQYIGR